MFQVNELEFAQVKMQVLDGLREGNEALKKMNEVQYIVDFYSAR